MCGKCDNFFKLVEFIFCLKIKVKIGSPLLHRQFVLNKRKGRFHNQDDYTMWCFSSQICAIMANMSPEIHIPNLTEQQPAVLAFITNNMQYTEAALRRLPTEQIAPGAILVGGWARSALEAGDLLEEIIEGVKISDPIHDENAKISLDRAKALGYQGFHDVIQGMAEI